MHMVRAIDGLGVGSREIFAFRLYIVANKQFAGKRFSRQRIHGILKGETEVNRFDLITLNFFVFSQKTEEYKSAESLYGSFIDSTNEILEKCFLGPLYIANPYECFILMCLLSGDPLGTYADVWELSYQE